VRLTAHLAVLAAVGALTLASIVSTSAAPGAVVLYKSGEEKVVENPVPRVCHRGLGDGTAIANRTDGIVLLFPDGACKTRLFDALEPGDERDEWAGGSFMALD
jgi:hypothetical protein